MLRLPEFVTREEFDWAVREATAKKKKDFSKVEFFTYDEGLCVQCMHLGSYDDEPETTSRRRRAGDAGPDECFCGRAGLCGGLL